MLSHQQLTLDAVCAYVRHLAESDKVSPATIGIRVGHLLGLWHELGDGVPLSQAFTHAEARRDQVGANIRSTLRGLASFLGEVIPITRRRFASPGRRPQATTIALGAMNVGRAQRIPKAVAVQILWRHLVTVGGQFVLQVPGGFAAGPTETRTFSLTPLQLAGLLWLRNTHTEYLGRKPAPSDLVFVNLPDDPTYKGPLAPASDYAFGHPASPDRWPPEVAAEIRRLADLCTQQGIAAPAAMSLPTPPVVSDPPLPPAARTGWVAPRPAPAITTPMPESEPEDEPER